jgi:hypothetical protein
MGTDEYGPLKVLHDQLLAGRPEGADEHDEANCPLCAKEAEPTNDTIPGGSMPETFSQEELDAAITAANSSLQTRLAELEAQVRESNVTSAVAAAVAEKDTEISGLQSQLDAAEAARTAAENRLTETEQFWAAAIREREEADLFAARRDERVAQAKEAGGFTDEYLAANGDRYAAMNDEDFKARLDEWRVIAAKSGGSQSSIPSQTALVASRAETSTKPESALVYMSQMRREHADPRALGGV